MNKNCRKSLLLLMFISIWTLALIGCRPKPSPVLLQNQIRDLLSLNLYAQQYREIIYVGEKKDFLFLNISAKEMLFSVDIIFTASMDLSKGLNVSVTENKAVIQLPPVEISYGDVREESIEMFLIKEKNSDIVFSDFEQAIEISKNALRKTAVSRGIISSAEKNARAIVSGLFQSLGYTEIEIIIPPSTETEES